MKEYWRHMSGALASIALGDPVIALMDGNARVGSLCSLTGRTALGVRCTGCCWIAHCAYLPLSSPAVKEGGRGRPRTAACTASTTWPCGRVVSATVDASVDLAISRADHRCAVVELYGAFSGSREAPPRPRLLYDRRALLDPATVDKAREKLKDVPNVSWDKGVDEHAATVTDFLLGTLAECCPRASARQSK